MPPQPVRHRLGPPVRAPEAAALLRTRPRPHWVCLAARQYSTHHGPSCVQTRAMRQSDSPVAVQRVGVSNGCADDAAAGTNPDWSHNDTNRPPEPRQFRRYYRPSPARTGHIAV
jgi:hypothetical protein